MPGVETTLPLLLNAVNNKKLKLEKLVELCCENPAKIFRIRNKGYIDEDFDADLTIIDMDMEKEVKNEEIKSKSGWSPYMGWKLKGWPVMTIIKGNVVYDNGKINDIKAKGILYEKGIK